jgi:hypothetical protein
VRTLPFVVLALASLASAARADVVEIDPSGDLEAAINALRPGDELVLRGGVYSRSDRFAITVVGTETMPIVIRAAEGERPVITRPDAGQNLLDIERAEYATIRGLEFTGGSAGVRITAARFLTIEDCEIHDTGDVALRANDVGARYEGLRILRNHIHDTHGTGEGMYLGCNSNGCQVFDSLIEGNWVHHTNASDVSQGDGIELKEGSHDNVIRWNVVHDTNYPCILTYGVVGNGGPNTIEQNVLWGCGDMGIQSAADATIRNNIILSAGANGIGCQPHQAATPANLVIVNNTVLDADGTALRLAGATGSVVIANNALYTRGATALSLGGDLSMLTLVGNVVEGAVTGASGGGTSAGSLRADFVAASFSGTVPNDVFPAAGGALVGAGSMAHLPALDFNGTPRSRPDVGAYAADEGGNPGWVLAEGFHAPPPTGGADAGMDVDAGLGRDGGREDGGGMGEDAGSSGRDAGAASATAAGCGCRAGRSHETRALVVLVALGLALRGRRTGRSGGRGGVGSGPQRGTR